MTRTLVMSLVMVVCSAQGSAEDFEFVDLSALLVGTTDSAAFGISPGGRVIGSVRIGGGEQTAALWTADSAEVVDSPFGSEYAQAINDRGVFVGTYVGSGTGWYSHDGEIVCVPLPDPCGSFNNLWKASSANDINTFGVFTGGISPEAGQPVDDPIEAYLGSITADGSVEIERLGDFFGEDTTGLGLNDSGDVVGVSGSGFDTTALLFRDGHVLPLPGLGGGYDWPEAINNTGIAAGVSARSEPGPWPYDAEAVVWDTGVEPIVITGLGRLPGHRLSRALDLNDSGAAVGFSVDAAFDDQRAVLWSNGKIVDLNTLLPAGSDWVLEVATSINDFGAIVGYGRRADLPGRRAFLLQPAPLFRGDFESGDLADWQ